MKKGVLKMKFSKVALVLFSISAMSGCAGLGVGEPEFACKGYPDGLRCMSSQDVYKLSDRSTYKEDIARVSAAQGGDPEKGINRLPGDKGHVEGEEEFTDEEMSETKEVEVRGGLRKEISDRYIPQVVPRPTKETIPLRTPAKVMRIYVAPWESSTGDLNVPSYVYTEIEPRRWMIGNKPIVVNRSIKPLRSAGDQPPVSDTSQ
jgi:conjugal transfer pilus assembly protein TraV